MKSDPNNSLLIAAQFLSEGSGGIAEVARMTAKSLAARFPTRALACQDREDFRFDNVDVRAFGIAGCASWRSSRSPRSERRISSMTSSARRAHNASRSDVEVATRCGPTESRFGAT